MKEFACATKLSDTSCQEMKHRHENEDGRDVLFVDVVDGIKGSVADDGPIGDQFFSTWEQDSSVNCIGCDKNRGVNFTAKVKIVNIRQCM